MADASYDIAIIGGGIAGLWTQAHLRARGNRVLLIAPTLGGGQTIASQGIIHGGVKYALGGISGDDSKAIAEMPEAWRQAMAGEAIVDLRKARLLSETCLLWTKAGVGARLMGAAAAKTIRAKPRRLGGEERPAAMRGAGRGVEVYALPEPVLDVASLVEALRGEGQAQGAFPGEIGFEVAGGHVREVRLGESRVEVRGVVLAGGAGNGLLLEGLGGNHDGRVEGVEGIAMQRRPLHMVMARRIGGDADARGELPEIFGHCVGMSPRPIATITTGRDRAGRRVWWIGGQVAEDGVGMTREQLIEHAKKEVGACVPWVDLSGTEWATWRVDRAEGGTGGRKPEGPTVFVAGNVVTLWPTKLAFAPKAAEMVETEIAKLGVPKSGEGVGEEPLGLSPPRVAAAPWDEREVAWS